MSTSLFNLQNKVAAISGGTGILGSAMAEALAQEGVKVALLDRDPDKSTDLKEKASHNGWVIKSYKADVLNENVMNTVRELVLSDFKKVDILINAAGGNMPGATIGPDEDILALSTEETKKVLELNYLGTVIPSQVFLKSMIENKKGC
ncbi:MAG: SDR family NAD(P)-dependent oxidoreductase, partial [Bacteroidota bacterium]